MKGHHLEIGYFFQALQLLSRLCVCVGSDEIQKKRNAILDAQQKLIESTLLKKVQQEKDMYLIKRTKTVIAVLNTPDIIDSKDDHPLQQSSGQSAKMYYEMKFTTDTRTSYNTSNCKLLTDVKESISTMLSNIRSGSPGEEISNQIGKFGFSRSVS